MAQTFIFHGFGAHDIYIYWMLYSLELTATLFLKINGWVEDDSFPFGHGPAYFQGYLLAVSFREGNSPTC